MATGVTSWDVALEQLFGLEPETFDGTMDAWVALLHPDDVDHVARDHRAGDRRTHAVRARTPRRLAGRNRALAVLPGHGDVRRRRQRHGHDRLHQRRHRPQAAGDRGRTPDPRTPSGSPLRERLHRERLEFLDGLNDSALSAADHRRVDAQRRRRRRAPARRLVRPLLRPRGSGRAGSRSRPHRSGQVRLGRGAPQRFPYDRRRTARRAGGDPHRPDRVRSDAQRRIHRACHRQTSPTARSPTSCARSWTPCS